MTLSQVRALLSPSGGVTGRSLSLFSPKGERRTVMVTLYDPLS